MHWTELVHMVRLIGAATGIIKAKKSGNQQRTLMVRDGVRPRKYAAGLAMESLAIGKEERSLRGKLLANLTALADK